MRLNESVASGILRLVELLHFACGRWGQTTHEREVMLDRPPGGATILCAVRLGIWSSI